MGPVPLATRRLAAQQIERHTFRRPADLVAWMGAVQAQDYGAAKWAVGLRLAGAAGDEALERAIAEGSVIRLHAFRGTWQLIAPADVHWMVALVAARVRARSAARDRELGLDGATLRRSIAAIARSLAGGERTRAELSAALRGAGIEAAGPRLAHILAHAELDALVCGGARRGAQPTWALLERRAPAPARAPARAESLAELASRYARSRGPVTARDFAWWSGLSAAEARAGLESASGLITETIAGRTYWRADRRERSRAGDAHLLPAFDEYLIAYQDRSDMLRPEHVRRLNAGGGMLGPCVVLAGQVVGTWRRTLARAAVAIEVDPFAATGRAERQSIRAAAARYAGFLAREPAVSFAR